MWELKFLLINYKYKLNFKKRNSVIHLVFDKKYLFQCQNGIGQGMTISRLNKNYA